MNRTVLLLIFLIVFYVFIQVVNVNAIPEAIKYKGTKWKYVGRAEISILASKSIQDHRVVYTWEATYTVTNIYSASVEIRQLYCEKWYVDGVYDDSLSKCGEKTFHIPLKEYTSFWVPVNPQIGYSFYVDMDVFWRDTFKISSIESDIIIAENRNSSSLVTIREIGVSGSYWAKRFYDWNIDVNVEYSQTLRFRRSDGLRIAYSDYHRAVNNDYGFCLIWNYSENLEYMYVPYYRVDIVIDGLPSDLSTDIYIDGVYCSKMKGGETKCLCFPIDSSHEVAVRELINLGSTRYVCRGNRFRVSTDTIVTFTYNVEYKVIVDVNPRITKVVIDGVSYNPPVELWYSKDSTIRISLENVEIGYDNYKYVFSGWSDGVKTIERTIVVNNPATYIAEYMLCYLFNVKLTTVKGEYVKADVYVDGVKLIGNFIPKGRHIVRVDEVVEVEPSWRRYVFTKWSTGETSNIIAIDVSSPVAIEAIYKTQYYLKIDSKFEVRGSGWYDENSIVDISLEKSTINIDEDTRYSFIGWSGDHAGNESRFSITMNSPKVITANWIKQYRIIITYNPRDIGADERWCNENSRELFRADEIIAVSSDVRYRFLNWEGISKDLNVEVTITNPLKLIKNYKRQYLVTLTSSYGNPVIRELGSKSGWIDDGEYITISIEKVVGFPIRKVFNGWYDEQNKLISKDPEYILRVDKPLKLNAKYTDDYIPLLIIVGSIAVACVSLFLYKCRVKPRLEVKPVVEKPLVEVKPPPSPELIGIVDEVDRVVGEVERYEGYLDELERRRGELSGDVYVRLKSMYEGEVAQRKSRIEDLTNKAVKMGAWKCLRCGMVNLPSINICRKCGWKQQ